MKRARRGVQVSGWVLMACCGLASAGCMGEPVNCLTALLPAAMVELRDERTGAPVCGPGIRTSANRRGGRVESEKLSEGQCSFPLWDVGVYAVHVDAPGYSPLDTTLDVPVNRGACGQETVDLELRLAGPSHCGETARGVV